MKNETSSTMKISILIVTLNRAGLLKKCLDSLIIQTRMPDEVIIVDNGSTDNTQEVVNKNRAMFPRLKYVIEKKRNIATAKNAGIRYSSGDILAFTDDDCICDKMWVENILKFHKIYPEVMAIGGKTISVLKNNFFHRVSQIIWDDNDIIENTKTKSSFLQNYFKKGDEISDAIHLRGCNISYKKDIFKRFEFDERLINCDDQNLHLSLYREGIKLLYIPYTIVKHYHRSKFSALVKQYFIYGRSYSQIYLRNRHFDLNIPVGFKKTVFFVFSPFVIVLLSIIKHKEEFRTPFLAISEFSVMLITRIIFKIGVLYEFLLRK
jgi:GT2 family glycosyltransferase